MTSYRTLPSASKRDATPTPTGPLRSLQLIETVSTAEPFHIVPVVVSMGTVSVAADSMAAKVRWAERAEYTVLTLDVPPAFAPYNAVIRVSDRGTEDMQRDYLAHLVFEGEDAQ